MPELWTPSGVRHVQSDSEVYGALAVATGNQDYRRLAKIALAKGQQGAVDNADVIAEMRANRRINKQAAGNGGVGAGGIGQFSFATARPRDPLFYWRQNNLPYDVAKDEELQKIRAFCRLLYITHPVIASAIDIYSKYPLIGMEMTGKDSELNDFYSDLFFDQLDYEEFLLDVGREYWTTGEAWPLGSFNDTLGGLGIRRTHQSRRR